MATVKSTGTLLTIREIEVILRTYPKGHPMRRFALRDVKVLRHYAAECGRQAVALWRKHVG